MLSDTPWLALFVSLIGHSKQLMQLCPYLIGWGLYSCLSYGLFTNVKQNTVWFDLGARCPNCDTVYSPRPRVTNNVCRK